MSLLNFVWCCLFLDDNGLSENGVQLQNPQMAVEWDNDANCNSLELGEPSFSTYLMHILNGDPNQE